jgi:acetate---CoA ligase (ADP-forming)
MDKLFYPNSLAIIGLSSKPNNIPRLVLENLIRWGYKGRILGVNPRSDDRDINGIRMYKNISDLPIVPDLVFSLVPAKLIPDLVDECGRFGVRWMAIPSGGFNELGPEGDSLSDLLLEKAHQYGIRFVGPNGLTVANTENGLCLPFVPSFSPPRGGLSIVTQSGGLGIMLWNFMTDQNVGMAKFASIGNKLDLDEVDFLEYLGRDPETTIIGLYLESITRGSALLEVARKIDKPVVILKSNTTSAGRKAAMSHTAALSNDDAIIDAAFEEADIIRISHFDELVTVAKAFQLPPMRGNRLMMMSPAGGITVMMADLCEKNGFAFAELGADFYEQLKGFSNAGVINFSNPLDMGDIYDPKLYAKVFFEVMHSDRVDGAVFVTQWPHMPRGEDVFYKMFHTDISKETTGAILSSGKPLGVCVFGLSATLSTIKRNLNFPIFDRFEEMMAALKKQADFHAAKARKKPEKRLPEGVDLLAATDWLEQHTGELGEESLELLARFGVASPRSEIATSPEQAARGAEAVGFPVVLKVISPDALHKSEAGGVLVGLTDSVAVKRGFGRLRENLTAYNPKARFEGARVMAMAGDGTDMFVGGKRDPSFGSAVIFGYGGIYVEVFKDIQILLCPASPEQVAEKVRALRSYQILAGARGKRPAHIDAFIDLIVRVSHLLHLYPNIQELDLNPVRLLADGSGAVTLDARIRIS